MLEFAGLALRYPDFEACYDLTVPAGALCAVIGPSGGGKTTLLHAIAGFERPSAGRLHFNGQDLLPLAPAARPVSILFQDHNLFPHLTAAENVGLGLKPSLRLDVDERERVAAALAEVNLTEFASRRPAELSGGQRQRVALARALLRGKPLMLLDEPFGALDPGLRREMIDRVDTLRRSHGLTVLMTLHTPEEAAQTADLFAFVANGRVEAAGPWDRLTAPGGPEPVRRFLGR
ncbi:MAG TPA: ATP-binding cassette domain-containing protein [Bosea sp. (in: a-proteobacteria)]|jgi:thiamine transport system ATP-binding protein|uniref:thiamine ABC transporter ATP-binding protein n=1 Tax=Bosea sp. (in: a-proteobacteria) TaxID=1871050 RepID=UPI002E0F5CC4|nr:ATP-binding cassette domain-containing protein [Bosea sp. (in: a-proteobacteria)]